MRPLIKVMLILACLFALTFVAGRMLGILTVDNVRMWLEQVNEVQKSYVAGVVILLLFADLFVAVPTLTVTLLAGYFLGFPLGAAAALVGVSSAAFTGYAISWRWGLKGINLLVRNDDHKADLKSAFHRNGPVMILLSRAAPIVPEVTACMAGATQMPIWRYSLFFALGTVPYVLIASYAGSISSVENPMPGIYAALVLYAVLWTGWYIFRRRSKSQRRLTDQGAGRSALS